MISYGRWVDNQICRRSEKRLKPILGDFHEVQIRFQDSKPDIHGVSKLIVMKDELIMIKNE